MINTLKKILCSILVTSICIILSNQINASKKDVKTKIFISQIVKHPALDATVKGIVDGLEEAGYSRDTNLDLIIEDAQGSIALANQIANKFISKKPDIVVGVATISAQSFMKYARNGNTKLIFTSVTDPVDANLVQTLNQPNNNTSGVSNFVELEPQIEMFLKIKPSLKKLGFLYNPGELNSLSIIQKLEEICLDYNIELVKITASKTSEVAQSAIKLSEISDAIFISNDNTALSAFKTIIKAANNASIPVFVSDIDIVKDGAVAAIGANQYELGKQTAQMIVKALNGENPGNISVEFPNKVELYLNTKAAEKIGISIPQDLIKSATYIAKTL